MRVREWYGYHFPELVRIVNENYPYCKIIKLLGRRENLLQAMQEQEDNEDEDAEAPELIKKMEEILMDSTKVQSIQDAARKSVGMEISDIDLINVDHFSHQVVQLVEYRKELQEYLRSKMKNVAPNLAALIGDVVGARLISHAGSITNLAKYPASTVQILGAEKALFRALKKKGNTPKYGLIFHSTFIGRAAQKNKGRISRYLANKASIASRLDCFSDEPNAIVGNVLKQQVEDRLNFFETGETPKKNIDVMHAAMDALKEGDEAKEEDKDEEMKTEEVAEEKSEEKKKKKKSKKNKRKSEAEEMDTEEPESKKSKEEVEEPTEEAEVASPEKKKKKKKKKSVTPDEE
jgi:RNA processing factor Prp31